MSPPLHPVTGKPLETPKDYWDAYEADPRERQRGLSRNRLDDWALRRGYGPTIGTKSELLSWFPEDHPLAVHAGRPRRTPEPEEPQQGPGLAPDNITLGVTPDNKLFVKGIDSGTY
jgi:hypothetical protein